jgi:cytochrome c-type biogenesis protein
MEEASTLALFGMALVAGLLSFLSPCVMPLMPAYLSLISGVSMEEIRGGKEGAEVRRRVMLSCLSFVLGFSTVFILLGASATFVGQFLRTWRVTLGPISFGIAEIAGLIIVVMGLHVAGIFKINTLYREQRFNVEVQRHSWIRTYVVGAAFAFGWSPCVGPILGTVLTIAASRETMLMGMALLAVYSLGLAIPFLITGWSIEAFFRAFQTMKKHFRAIEIGSGVLLIIVGLLIMTGQFTRLNSYFGFLNDLIYAIEGWFL